MTFKRRPDAEGNDGDAIGPADADDLLHFFGALRIDNGIGRLVGNPGDGIAMLLAHRLRCHNAIAEGGGESCNRFSYRCGVSALLLGGDGGKPQGFVFCGDGKRVKKGKGWREKGAGGSLVGGTTAVIGYAATSRPRLTTISRGKERSSIPFAGSGDI